MSRLASDVIVPQSFLFAIPPKAGPITQTRTPGTTHILSPDLNKSIPKLLNSEGVNYGIDGGVAVTEQDGNIQQV